MSGYTEGMHVTSDALSIWTNTTTGKHTLHCIPLVSHEKNTFQKNMPKKTMDANYQKY